MATQLPAGQALIEVDQITTLLRMVEAGVGAALMSAMACPARAF